VPKIDLVAPVFEGVTSDVLDEGTGHWPGTARPGAWGNTVIAGHRVTHTRPFYDLDRLATGDEIILFVPDGTRYVYRVTEMGVVDPSATWIVRQEPGFMLTLFACHPKGSAAQRIVVRAAAG
jgi:sortase A